MNRQLRLLDWSWADTAPPDEIVERIVSLLSVLMAECIPSSRVRFNSSHPWLDERCLKLVQAKCDAVRTDAFPQASFECSRGLLAAQAAYVDRTRRKLRSLKRGSKQWWR